jgi:hypothetical protein
VTIRSGKAGDDMDLQSDHEDDLFGPPPSILRRRSEADKAQTPERDTKMSQEGTDGSEEIMDLEVAKLMQGL